MTVLPRGLEERRTEAMKSCSDLRAGVYFLFLGSQAGIGPDHCLKQKGGNSTKGVL